MLGESEIVKLIMKSEYTSPYYTQGDSASGAMADYHNTAACQAVAVYSGSSPVPTDEAIVKSL